MQTLILAFILMLLVFGGMAVGVLIQRKAISGSCGGIGALGMDKACDCDKPCDKKQARMAEKTRQEKETEWKRNQIS
ncbi:MAG: hypothetical protein HLUCCO02_12265 [Idiomarinaceae bacterium HL-53]|nr:MAG: hypothetical protein HLUCCO02_12265 [Idiomarinaceae bacterium HL-53]CUS49577.1 hypothetical protein Ga0003345_2577 [Idiomarinaceae bacterium HL-53]